MRVAPEMTAEALSAKLEAQLGLAKNSVRLRPPGSEGPIAASALLGIVSSGAEPSAPALALDMGIVLPKKGFRFLLKPLCGSGGTSSFSVPDPGRPVSSFVNQFARERGLPAAAMKWRMVGPAGGLVPVKDLDMPIGALGIVDGETLFYDVQRGYDVKVEVVDEREEPGSPVRVTSGWIPKAASWSDLGARLECLAPFIDGRLGPDVALFWDWAHMKPWKRLSRDAPFPKGFGGPDDMNRRLVLTNRVVRHVDVVLTGFNPELPSAEVLVEDIAVAWDDTVASVATKALVAAGVTGAVDLSRSLWTTRAGTKVMADRRMHPEGLRSGHRVTIACNGGDAILIHLLTGSVLSVVADLGATVDMLKLQLQAMEGVPADQQRIIHRGVQLEDGRSLTSYGVGPGDKLHLVLRLRGGMMHASVRLLRGVPWRGGAATEAGIGICICMCALHAWQSGRLDHAPVPRVAVWAESGGAGAAGAGRGSGAAGDADVFVMW